MKPLLLFIFALTVERVYGHETFVPRDRAQLIWAWEWEPGVIFLIGAVAALYWLGLMELKEAGLWGRAFKRWQGASFAAGHFALIVALISPLHAWGEALFSAHMTQHELLMLVAAPLLILGRPVPVLLKGLPASVRRTILRFGRTSLLSMAGAFLSNAFIAWLLHGVILWIWHLPVLFNSTLESKWVHAAQHLSFFGSALLFWWAVLDGHQKRLGYGMGVLYLFTTALHSGILGALLTFSRSIWYAGYSNTTQTWGLTPLEDQQLGGLIMWIPAAIVYIIAALALFAAWLRESEVRANSLVSCPEPPLAS